MFQYQLVCETVTNEYGFPDPMESDHWRMYGDDFEDRLAESGLAVQAINFNLPDEDYRRYSFNPEHFNIFKKMEISGASVEPFR